MNTQRKSTALIKQIDPKTYEIYEITVNKYTFVSTKCWKVCYCPA